jgi:hypothetical protein
VILGGANHVFNCEGGGASSDDHDAGDDNVVIMMILMTRPYVPQVILGGANHVFNCEGGGASSLLGLPYHTVETQPDGTYRMADLENGEGSGASCERKRSTSSPHLL